MNRKKTSKATNKATKKSKAKDTKTKGKKHKKLTPEKMKIIKGGQINPTNNPGGCTAYC